MQAFEKLWGVYCRAALYEECQLLQTAPRAACRNAKHVHVFQVRMIEKYFFFHTQICKSFMRPWPVFSLHCDHRVLSSGVITFENVCIQAKMRGRQKGRIKFLGGVGIDHKWEKIVRSPHSVMPHPQLHNRRYRFQHVSLSSKKFRITHQL